VAPKTTNKNLKRKSDSPLINPVIKLTAERKLKINIAAVENLHIKLGIPLEKIDSIEFRGFLIDVLGDGNKWVESEMSIRRN
jgi:hypothetical protein